MGNTYTERVFWEHIEMTRERSVLNALFQTFVEKNGMVLLCTTVRYENGVFQGDLSTPICNYAEKARRIRAAFPLESFDQIIAWGNSEGDEAMFALSDWVYDFRKDPTWEKNFPGGGQPYPI